MDAVIARIKEYVLIIDSTIEDNDFLDFVVAEIVDRALAFTRRDQLLTKYEEDLVDYPDADDSYWIGYHYPIPKALERALANTVVGAYKNTQNRNDAETGAITSVEDNGQKVSYTKEIANFLSSSDDAEVFSGTLRLLKRYVIGYVPQSTARLNDINDDLNRPL